MRQAQAVAFGLQYLRRKRLIGPLLRLRSRVPRKFRLVIQTDRVLFIQAGSAEWIDSVCIQLDMPGDCRCRQLRNGNHKAPLFQAGFEGLQRVFRDANDRPVTTSKHVGNSSPIDGFNPQSES
jgi:hypothetical protein